MCEKTYEFTIVLIGRGENKNEAWNDAVEAFTNEPGDESEYGVLIEDKEE